VLLALITSARAPSGVNTSPSWTSIAAMLRINARADCTGAKPTLIPLPVPVLRAVRDAIAERAAGPLMLNRHGERLSRQAAAGQLSRLAHTAGLTQHLSPHTLRRTFCTAGLISGVPLRNMHYAMRHADSRTTPRYDGPAATSTGTPPTRSPPTSPG